jgi:hypothetical protein
LQGPCHPLTIDVSAVFIMFYVIDVMGCTGVNNLAGQKRDLGMGGQIVLDLTACRCMDPTGRRRFDLLFGTRLLLELAQERSLE